MAERIGRHTWLAFALIAPSLFSAPVSAQLSKPGTAPAQGPSLPQDQRQGDTDPQGNAPIVPDSQFNAALPPLSGDINAPLESMSSMAKDQPPSPTSPQTIPLPQTAPPLPNAQTAQPLATGEAIGAIAPEDPQLAQPLTPLASFDSTPLDTVADTKSKQAPDFIKKWVAFGASVRAAQYLVLGGKARALTSGRYHVSFEDIRALAHPVLRHRVLTNFHAGSEGITTDSLVDQLLEAVPVPRSGM